MSRKNSFQESVGRRSVLRGIGVASGFALGGFIGTASVQATSPMSFEADTSDIPGLDKASIVVKERTGSSQITYQYSWNPEIVRKLDTSPDASVSLDIPGQSASDDRPNRVAIDSKALEEATAVVEQPANTSSVRSTVDQINPSVGTSSKWDLIPYVVTKSLLCGVLAESELRIDSVFFPGVGTSYTDYDFNAQDYDATCKDEWYVPGPFNTVWYTDGTTSDMNGSQITASSNFHNNDFPLSGTVYADHTFDVSPNSHDMTYNHYGDLSYIVLGPNSHTGYR